MNIFEVSKLTHMAKALFPNFKIPDEATLTLWADTLTDVPGNAIPSIVTHVARNNDWFTIRAAYQAWNELNKEYSIVYKALRGKRARVNHILKSNDIDYEDVVQLRKLANEHNQQGKLLPQWYREYAELEPIILPMDRLAPAIEAKKARSQAMVESQKVNRDKFLEGTVNKVPERETIAQTEREREEQLRKLEEMINTPE